MTLYRSALFAHFYWNLYILSWKSCFTEMVVAFLFIKIYRPSFAQMTSRCLAKISLNRSLIDDFLLNWQIITLIWVIGVSFFLCRPVILIYRTPGHLNWQSSVCNYNNTIQNTYIFYYLIEYYNSFSINETISCPGCIVVAVWLTLKIK